MKKDILLIASAPTVTDIQDCLNQYLGENNRYRVIKDTLQIFDERKGDYAALALHIIRKQNRYRLEACEADPAESAKKSPRATGGTVFWT
jgi:hypothetical protein